jgi:hypothetical protein
MNEEKEPPNVKWIGLIDVTLCPKTMRPCEVTGCLGCEYQAMSPRSICSGIGITEQKE